MAKIERPKLEPQVEFHLERIQNKADAEAWVQLEPLLVPSESWLRMQAAQRNPYLPSRPLPKQPQQILIIIRGYARTLYISEGNLYESGPQIEAQLRALMRRIVTRVMRTINAMQTDGLSFKHHGVTDRKMRTAIVSEVGDLIRSRLSPPPRAVTRAPRPPSAVGGNYAPAGGNLSSGSPLLIMAQTAARKAQEAVPKEPPSMVATLRALKRESRLSAQKIADGIGVNLRTVQRHLAGTASPRDAQILAYEGFFTNHLGRPIKMP